jgi:predicted dehydrogenase
MKDITSLQQAWPLPTRKVPIALVGAGGIVNDAHLPAYRKAGFPVAGIFDQSQARALATAKKWNIARVWPGMTQLLADANNEEMVFDVAVPPACTAAVLEQLPAGAAVLMQKPMGDNFEAAHRIVAICRARGLLAAVNHQLRFAPYMLAVRDALRRGWLGTLTDVEMRLNCADPWHLFPFLERMDRVEIQVHSIHYLDLIRSLLGEPAGIYALTLRDKRFPRLKSTRSSIILNYGDATRVCLTLNHNYAHGAHRQDATFKFEGDEGCVYIIIGVMLNYPKGVPDLCEIKVAGGDWSTLKLEGTWFPDAFIGPMANLQRYRAGEDAQLLTRVTDVLETMRLVEAAYRSSATGGTALPAHE